MNRRRFAFWLGMGLFGLAEKLNAQGLDSLAAAAMRATDTAAGECLLSKVEHWRAAGDSAWRWYEREHYVDGRWKVTGITTPISRKTGEPYTEKTGYLDESLIPSYVRDRERLIEAGLDPDAPSFIEADTEDPGEPHAARRSRHGRPPSKWLRNLYADELRVWLKTIDVPEAGVSGMTYWTHLTRDHFFDPYRIAGLTEEEQAKLHAAAHYGY